MNKFEASGYVDEQMLDLRAYREVNRVTQVEAGEYAIRVTWSEGGKSKFYYAWFRENCACTECRDISTLERNIDPLHVPFDVKPTDIDLRIDGTLVFTWPDAHKSLFPSSWLWFHCPENERNMLPTVVPETPGWNLKQANALPEMTYENYMTNDALLLSGLNDVLDKGCMIVTGVPAEEDAIIPFTKRISFLRETHYGTTFHVRYAPNPISFAHTNKRLFSHTDLPNYDAPPGVQFFHCIRNDAEGGETILVDGFAVAERLREQSPHLFNALVENTLSFRLQDMDNDRFSRNPVIELDFLGRLKQIRYSRTNVTPYVGSSDTYEIVREAYLAFSKLVEDPEFERKFKLEPGDCLITDNVRMMHGRCSFERDTGDRHLQGCYIDREDLISRKEMLSRTDTNILERVQ